MTQLPEIIKILHVEDLATDAEFIHRELKKGSLNFELFLVDNKDAYEKALQSFKPHIILCDHSLPGFNSIEALLIARTHHKDLPFILITSAMPDEFAVSILQMGANDYIIKDRLQRLNTAVLNALEKYSFEKEKREFIEMIERNEKRFRTIIEKSSDMITLSNEKGKMMYGSPSIKHLFGYEPQEIINITAVDFVHPNDKANYLAQRKKLLLQAGKSIQLELRLKHKLGHWVWCEATISNMLHEPDIQAIVSNFKDVSEKKNLQNQRELDAENLNALINNTQDLMWSVDLNFNLITSNIPFQNSLQAYFGFTIKNGMNVFEIGFDQLYNARFKRYFERAFAGETFTVIEYNELPIESWSEISFYPIKHGDEIIGCACFLHDITNRKIAEQEREKMLEDIVQRSKNLEQFTYIVSHNLRAPVAHILGISQVLKTNLSEEERQKSLNYIFEAAENLDQVTKDLNQILQIKSETIVSKQSFRLSVLLNDVKAALNHVLNARAYEMQIDFSLADEIHSIKSYFHSIFFNLLSNSIKYRNKSNTLRILAKSRFEQHKLLIEFSDNGIGFDMEKNQQSLFGLYKRFHPHIEGKGVGLYMVKTQVEALGGKINVKSGVNQGSHFFIELPYP